MIKKYFKIFLINIIILFFCIEFLSFLLTKINVLPNGLPPHITLNAHEDFSYWHPENSEFKIATKCWQSKVKFNNFGIKSNDDLNISKTKKRIAILGDSMTQNSQLSNEKDFTAKLQKFLPDYEIINFSISSVGLADQINIYNKLVKKFNVDFIFMYVTSNDFSDNHYSEQRPNRITYKIENNNIVEINIDKSIFFKKYNSKLNKFKRNYLIYIKKMTYSFKLYHFLKWEYISYKYKREQSLNKKIKYNNTEKLFEEKYAVYKYLVEKANNEIFMDVPTMIFMNSDNNSFIRETKEIKAIKEIYKNYNFYDPRLEFTKYLKDNGILKKPYLGYDCDAHYSSLGAKLLAEFTYDRFVEFNND